MAVALGGWRLEDAALHKHEFAQSSFIPAKRVFLVQPLQKNFTLNNGSESVVLVNPSGEPADSVTYERAKQGQSFTRIDDSFVWTTKTSPGAVNSSDQITVDASGNSRLAGASDNDKSSSFIELEGIVVALPDTTEDQAMYLNNVLWADDGKKAVKIIGTGLEEIADQVTLGDRVRLVGEKRRTTIVASVELLSADDLRVLGHGVVVEPLSFDEADPKNDTGRLVSLSGTVIKRSSGGYSMESTNGKKVTLRPPLDEELSALPQETTIEATGILMRQGTTLRVLLRSLDDMKIPTADIIEEAPPISSGQPTKQTPWLPIVAVGGSIATVFGAVVWKYRKKQSTALPDFDEEIL